MSGTVPYDRIAPQDIYRQLDWVRRDWGRNDVFGLMQKIVRLRKTYGRLPTVYYVEALPAIDRLKRMDDDPAQLPDLVLRELAEIVRRWDQKRKARRE